MPRPYAILDVFTDRPLAGNPLAVILDATGLDTAAMGAIAREFNLSETVFCFPPADNRHRARLRIFTPRKELPFAGHPTVGTAVLLALRDGLETDAAMFGLEEEIGTVSCIVEKRGERGGYARFRLPRLPEVLAEVPDEAACAWALGLDPTEIGFDRHVPSRHSAGNPFTFIPVSSLDGVARAVPNRDALAGTVAGESGIFCYSRQTTEPGRHFHARMFSGPMTGTAEDPATGSAVAAFAGVLMQCEPLGDGEHSFVVEQGYEMGRPSVIELQVTIADGALAGAEIGGSAVIVAEGEFHG